MPVGVENVRYILEAYIASLGMSAENVSSCQVGFDILMWHNPVII